MPELTQDQKIIEQLSLYLNAAMRATLALAHDEREKYHGALTEMVAARHEAVRLGFLWPYPDGIEPSTWAPPDGDDEQDGGEVQS